MEELNRTGMILEKIGRRVGRQAAMIAQLTSRNDHIAASTLSQLGSSVEAAIFRVRMRMMEMMQVLVRVWLALVERLRPDVGVLTKTRDQRLQ